MFDNDEVQVELRCVTYANKITGIASRSTRIITVGELDCGMGHVGHHLFNSGLAYVGFDGDAGAITAARDRYPHLALSVRDIYTFPRKADVFDLMCSFNSLQRCGKEEWRNILFRILSSGIEALVRVQTRSSGLETVDDPSPSAAGARRNVARNVWINERELKDAVEALGYRIHGAFDCRDASKYMHGGSVWLMHVMKHVPS